MVSMRSTLILLIFFCLFMAILDADVVKLKDGRELEGRIVEETGGFVVLKMKYGKQKISRTEIKEIIKKETPSEVFKKRFREIGKKDLDAHLELADWCKEMGLFSDMRKVYSRVLRFEPENNIAHSGLGHVQYKGKWYTRKELKSVQDAELRAKGYVKYKGKWVPRQEKEALEKGLVKVGDRWLTPDEAKEEEGFVKYNGEWVKPDEKKRRMSIDELEDALGIRSENLAATITDHFIVRGHTEQETTENIAKIAEEILAFHVEVFKFRRPCFWTGKAQIFLFDEQDSYDEFISSALGRKFFKDERSREMLLNRSKGGVTYSPPTIIKTEIERSPYDPRVMHSVSHLCLKFFCGAKDPSWLMEGLGSFVEHKFYGKSLTHCTTTTSYGDKGEIADKNKSSDQWIPLILESVESETDSCFEVLLKLDLNQLDYEHLSKSWSIVTFMMEKHQEDFVRFIANLRRMKQPDALKKAMGWESHGFNPENPSAFPPHGLDGAWRKWVLEEYPKVLAEE